VSDPAVPPIRAVLLDLDDTLVPWNTTLHWQWAWKPRGPVLLERHVRAAIRRQLHRWDRERWLGLVGRGPATDPESYRRFLGETLTAIADRPLPDDESTAVVDRFLKPGHESESYNDALQLVRGLEERGVKVGVVADLPAETARLALRRSGLPDSLLVVADDDPGPRPPMAAGFRAAVDRLGCKPPEVLFVGDLFWSDVRAAGRAGMSSVLIDRPDALAKVQGPRVRSLAEVRPLVDKPPTTVVPEPTEGDGPSPE
jgi:HAD superfamily hydrolase (TIGR01549 family)